MAEPASSESMVKTRSDSSNRKKKNSAGREIAHSRLQKLRAVSGDGTKQVVGLDRDAMIAAQSDQIPAAVLEKTRNQTIPLPLGERSFEDLSALLLDSTDFAAVVDQIATDTVGMEWRLHPLQGRDSDRRQFDRAMRFLDSANPEQTLTEVLTCASNDFEALGNAWIEVVREKKDPKRPPIGLIHAPGMTMRLNSNGEGHVQLGRDLTKTQFFRPWGSNPEKATSRFPRGHPRQGQVMNEMLYLRQYHVGSPWYGIPKITPAMTAISGNQYAADRNVSFFLNKAMPEWAVLVEGNTDNVATEDLEEFKDQIEAHFENILRGKHHKTLYLELPNGITVKFEKLSGDMLKDADFRQYRLDNRDEVLRAYHMMPNRVGVIETGNIGAGTGESQIEIYKNSVVKPKKGKWERVINSLLRSLGVRDWEFRFDEIDTVDEAREATITQILSATGVFTVNEGRKYATDSLSQVTLQPIDEAWANLPLPILLAVVGQAGLASVPPETVDSIREAAGVGPVGLPLGAAAAPGLNQSVGQMLRSDEITKALVTQLTESVLQAIKGAAAPANGSADASSQEETAGA